MLKSCHIYYSKFQYGLKVLIPIILLAIYTIFGGFLFHFLESPNEIKQIAVLKQERIKLFNDILDQISTKTDKKSYNRAILSLYELRRKLLKIEPNCQADSVMEQQQWNLLGSIYFCITVYTTIGYGNQAPTTGAGRVFTIIYAFVGIPMALIVLLSLGNLFLESCMKFCRLFGSHGKKIKNVKKKGDNDEAENDLSLQFPIWFLISAVVVWILFCAFLFTKLEGWNYGISLYFVLISFLSIGFGDIYPSKSENAIWSILLIAIMLLVGLALVYAVLALIQKYMQSLVKIYHNAIEENI